MTLHQSRLNKLEGLFRFALYCLFFGLLRANVLAQVSTPGVYFDRLNKRSDSTTLSLHKSIAYSQANKEITFIDPLTKISYNSTYPRGFNDGPVWKGKGLTMELHGGLQSRLGKLSLTFVPVIYYSQNTSFDLAPRRASTINELNYQFSSQIDWVQRYGTSSFVSFEFGQSELKLDLGKINFSVSSQNYSLGPAVFNPIIMSRQGAGFPHVRIGLEPIATKIRKLDIGKVEANLLYGILQESDYFDEQDSNDQRFFNSLFIAYSPSFLEGLTIGFNKILYKRTEFFELEDLISTAVILDRGIKNGDTLSPNDTFDQIASITMDWNLRESGFRAYAEFAKNDFNGSLFWQLSEPEHSRAFTIGFEKIVSLNDERSLLLNYEHTNLSRSLTFLYRPEPSFYAHGINRQGYTHKGQLIGSGIGPGGNSDHLAIDFLHPDFKLGLLIQRIESNKDYFAVNILEITKHDQEYSLGVNYSKEGPAIDWIFNATYSKSINRYFIRSRDNLFLSTAIRFKLSR